MKFDIVSYLENYKTLEFITGSSIGAFWLCFAIGVAVWIISYLLVGRIFETIGFYGNGKFMSICNWIISTIITGLFYNFLTVFQKPIAWIFKNWILCLILFVGFIILVNCLPFIIEMCFQQSDSQN